MRSIFDNSFRLFGIAALSLLAATTVHADALERLTAARLAATHEAIGRLKAERHEPARTGSLRDYRTNLHVHSAFSHDSRGTIAEIVAAAKTVGTQVVMFTEHPAEHYDFVTDGHQGLRDGVLLIPGAETKGLLVFPRQSVRGLDGGTPQEFADVVRGRQGLAFLSHLEERLDWQLRGLTGVEIYNTHADFKDEKKLIAALRNPLWLFTAAELFRQYPQEAFSALQDYPADYLRRWDQLCQLSPHTGVSANDAHQNVGLVIRLAEDNKARLESALGEKLIDLDASTLTALEDKVKNARIGDVLFELRLDRYEHSLRHVGTHLLLAELSVDEVWRALEAGRAYVAFDWLADATGFELAAVEGSRRHELGSRVKRTDDLRLVGHAPLAARWKLFRSGQSVAESTGRECSFDVKETGNYRVELWLDVASEPRLWIASNPIYVEAGP